MANLVKEFKSEPYVFIENHNLGDLLKLAKYAKDKYFNETPVISDSEYDLIIDKIKLLSPNNAFLKKVGSTTMEKNKVKLPYYMGSMNKFKPTQENEINQWITKYKSPYYISDKLDGVSALYFINQDGYFLYTRGDGKYGTDITLLLEYISCPINIDPSFYDNGIAIRGELIMKKSKFEKYKNDMANARNMVSGIVNAKKIIKDRAEDIDFVAYEIIEPWMNFSNQFDLLKKLKFKTVFHQSTKEITVENLSKFLKNRKEKSEYEIDGIIISHDSPKKRSNNSNPDYSFAFKETLESNTALVKVIDVLWNESKDGYLKPRLELEPTQLSGVTITHVTAFNAKYINDNNIGPGTIIKLVRSGDVIPHILEVVKSTKSKLPTSKWKWSESGVDIIIDDKSDEGIISELIYFVKKLHMKYIDEGVLKKLVDNGITTFIDIIQLEEDDLVDIPGFKEKMIEKIIDQIDTAIENMTLLDLMVASNIARGLGEKKLGKIINDNNIITDFYNKDVTKKEVYDYVHNLEGFDDITTNLFVDNLPNFINLLKKLPEDLRDRLLKPIPKTKKGNNLFKDMKVVFSGFRNKDWEKFIESEGGSVTTTVSNNTNILVAKQEDIDEGKNLKIVKAKQLGITIIEITKFAKKYKLS